MVSSPRTCQILDTIMSYAWCQSLIVSSIAHLFSDAIKPQQDPKLRTNFAVSFGGGEGVTAPAEDDACSPPARAVPGEAGAPAAQPWGMHLHNNAERVACPSLMKQIAWENDQADAWQLSRYIRNPVLNIPLPKNAQVCASSSMCRQSPFMWKKMFPAAVWSKTTYTGSMEEKDDYSVLLSVRGRSRQEAFLSAIVCLGPAGSPAQRLLTPRQGTPHPFATVHKLNTKLNPLPSHLSQLGGLSPSSSLLPFRSQRRRHFLLWPHHLPNPNNSKPCASETGPKCQPSSTSKQRQQTSSAKPNQNLVFTSSVSIKPPEGQLPSPCAEVVAVLMLAATPALANSWSKDPWKWPPALPENTRAKELNAALPVLHPKTSHERTGTGWWLSQNKINQ